MPIDLAWISEGPEKEQRVKFSLKQLTVIALFFACDLAFSQFASADPIAEAKADAPLKVGTLKVSKILFLGNSITLHGPAPQIGWTGNWGMAASAREKDYVHLLVDHVSKATNGTPKIMVRNIADFERNLLDFSVRESLKDELAFEADVIIVAIGENAAVPKTDEARKAFATAVANLLAQLKQQGHPTILVRSQFWPEQEKDQILKNACTEAGGVFVDINKLGRDPANAARSERQFDHDGVAGHPGDKGMAAIAEELWRAIKSAGDDKK